ncbi:Spt23 protein [Saccharomycopsis crataegensis]|uniref:Spt23 protein n=1 Tax=Saccharomycopsis crataegensis TaxID=43959 RepID=A0AAV5QRB3_9ASCO|nr:Spt23 protein [Saccharomycopsis crataegensis]
MIKNEEQVRVAKSDQEDIVSSTAALDHFLYMELSKGSSAIAQNDVLPPISPNDEPNGLFGNYFAPSQDNANSFQDSLENSNNNSVINENSNILGSQNPEDIEIDNILNNFRATSEAPVSNNLDPDMIQQPNMKGFKDFASFGFPQTESLGDDSSPGKILDHKDEKFQEQDMDVYNSAMGDLKHMKFGGFSIKNEDLNNAGVMNKQIPPNLFLPQESMDWNPDQNYSTTDNLPFKIKIGGLPDFSRVETQIKVDLQISPRPQEYLVHLSTDLISKKKFCLKDGVENLSPKVRQKMLYLDCFVISDTLPADNVKPEATEENASLYGLLQTDNFKSCNICSKCVKRELKRASRRKNGLSEDGLNWIDVIPKKAIIFNSKEVISLPPPLENSSLNLDRFKIHNNKNYSFNFFGGIGNSNNDDSSLNNTPDVKNDDDSFADSNSTELELSARIVCYCRHHQAQRGFKLLFILKNYKGEIVGKNFSKSIMIMDRKKALESNAPETRHGSISSTKRTKSIDANPMTPPSLDEDSSDHRTSDTSKSNKRTKLSQPSNTRYFNNKVNINNNPFGNNFNKSINGPISLDPNSLSPSSDNAHSSTAYNSRSPGDSSAVLTSFTNLSSPNYVKSNNINNNNNNNNNSPINNSQLNGSISGPLASPTAITGSFSPTIQKVIPAEGPIRGGIEITLLGVNFKPGLKVKFGNTNALGTHCWSDSTIVTFLPPASKPGQVLVTFEDDNSTETGEQFMKNEHSQIFTYTDDTDRQLIELALQIVGLKMNGKLEDARNIARRIVGTDSLDKSGGGNNNGVDNSTSNNTGNTRFNTSHHTDLLELDEQEVLLLKLINVCDLPNAPSSPNWQICTKENQTLLHLACFRGFRRVVSALLNRGARVNCKDVNGFTPLHFAALSGHPRIVSMLFKAKAHSGIKNNAGLTASAITSNLQVKALIREYDYKIHQASGSSDDYLANTGYGILRTMSSSSLSSLSSVEENYLRYHVSRMAGPGAQETGIVPERGFLVNDDEAVIDPSESDNADDEDDAGELDQAEVHSTRAIATSNITETAIENNCDDVDNDLPAYDDLYPGGDPTVAKNVKYLEALVGSSTSAANGDVGSSGSIIEASEVDTGSEGEESEDSSQENAAFNYYLYFTEKNKSKAFSNDKMLLFFWVPLLMIIGSFYVYSQFAGVESLNKLEEKTVNHIREALYKLMVGKERMEGLINDQLNILSTAREVR